MSNSDDDELSQLRAERAARLGTAGMTVVGLFNSPNRTIITPKASLTGAFVAFISSLTDRSSCSDCTEKQALEAKRR